MNHNQIISEINSFITKEERLSWNNYFMSMAYLISLRSPSSKLKVGAIIIRDNRVISSGYNGYPTGTPHESVHIDGHEINTIHAEQNAIADAARRGVSINEAQIYITHFPCVHCCKFIIASGIKHVFYHSDYNNSPVCYKLFQESNVSLSKL